MKKRSALIHLIKITMLSRCFLILLLTSSFLYAGCYSKNKKKMGVNMVNDSEFFKIDLSPWPSGEETVCSPKISDDFRGIKIAMPKKIMFDENMIIPLCGVFQFNGEVVRRYDNIDDEFVIVVVDNSNNKIYSAKMKPDFWVESRGDIENTEEPKPINEHILNEYCTGWFNIDIKTFIKISLPQGDYMAYIVFDEFKSNTVSFKVHK